MNFERVASVQFPTFTGVMCNMMPFVMGDAESLPAWARAYAPLVDRCARIERGKVAYLTVNESVVPAGATQRRPGIHTEGTASMDHGGHGGKAGLYLASTDGSCRVWDEYVPAVDVDAHGGLRRDPRGEPVKMSPGELYWMHDRVPHEALPVERDTARQFFRVVSNQLGAWYAKHNTVNPLGVLPDCPVIHSSKFGGDLE